MPDIKLLSQRTTYYFAHPEKKDKTLRLEFEEVPSDIVKSVNDFHYILTDVTDDITALCATVWKGEDFELMYSFCVDKQYEGFTMAQEYPHPFVLCYRGERITFDRL